MFPLTPAFVTTTLGAVLAIGVGIVDAKTGSTLGTNVDLAFVAAGLGALLGFNPLAARTVP